MTDDEDDEVLEYLKHHGVKGQRWGVITKKDTSGEESAVQKALKENPSKPLTKQQKANIADASKKFEAQRDLDPEAEKKGWRPTKKQLITIGVGVGVATAVVGGVAVRQHYQNIGAKPFSVDQYKKFVNPNDPPSWINGFAGQKMSVEDFKGITQTSVGRVWGEKQYLTAKSFDQKETVFPVGHKFFRVSHRAETEFRESTFCVPSRADLARYQLGWKSATTNVIDFDAKAPIRVPDLHTRLEATREVMRSEGIKNLTPDKVMARYSNFAGSDFTGSPTGKGILANLRAKGFHAIVDDMDWGVYGEMPLVLIDNSRVSSKNNISPTSSDLKRLADILTDLPNRR